MYGFPLLVCFSSLKGGLDGGCVRGLGWEEPLNLCFDRHLNDWEVDDVEAFFSKLQGSMIRREEKDKHVWMDSKNGVSSIKSLYSILVCDVEFLIQRPSFGILESLQEQGFLLKQLVKAKYWLGINFKREYGHWRIDVPFVKAKRN